MKKIIGLLSPFDMIQKIYVYENGNQLELVPTKVSDIPDTVLELASTYDIIQVDLVGSSHYAQGIMRKIQEEELTKFNQSNLIIKCI